MPFVPEWLTTVISGQQANADHNASEAVKVYNARLASWKQQVIFAKTNNQPVPPFTAPVPMREVFAANETGTGFVSTFEALPVEAAVEPTVTPLATAPATPLTTGAPAQSSKIDEMHAWAKEIRDGLKARNLI